MILCQQKAYAFPANYVSQINPYPIPDYSIVYKRKILAYAKAIKEEKP